MLLLGIFGCGSDPTGIRLHIDTDLRVPSELGQLRILISPEGGVPTGSLGLDRTVVPGVDAELPIVIGIVPEAGDASRRVHVLVEPAPGPELDQPLVPFDRVLSFVADEVRDVDVSFPASCALRGADGCVERCEADDHCDDGVSCTRDRCDDRECVHVPDDGLCGIGSCDPVVGCDPGPCEGSACDAGLCPPDGCDDGDPCTIDWCDEMGGCQHRASSADEEGREVEGCPAS